MKKISVALALAGGVLSAQSIAPKDLEVQGVKAESVTYKGRAAVRLVNTDEAGTKDSPLAIIKGTSFQDGTIEIAMSGDTAPNAPVTLRGFVGVAFRVADGGGKYECFYLRPKNGRSEDQLQRNHSAQYISVPGFPWEKLRADTPGKYESYVDLVPGEWTRVSVRVAGGNAWLYVNGAAQPVLIVHDLKQPRIAGQVALWVGPGTIAHVADLKITQ